MSQDGQPPPPHICFSPSSELSRGRLLCRPSHAVSPPKLPFLVNFVPDMELRVMADHLSLDLVHALDPAGYRASGSARMRARDESDVRKMGTNVLSLEENISFPENGMHFTSDRAR